MVPSRPALMAVPASFVLALFLLASCGNDNGGTDPATTGSVRVVAAVGGTGVAGSGFTLSRSGQSNRTGTGGADGSFTFNNLQTGSWTLTIVPPAGHDLATGQSATVSVTVVAGQTTTVNVNLVALAGTGTITASVDADGSPRSGVSVELFTDGGATPIATGTTGAAGTFDFTGLTAGSYDLAIVVPAGFVLAPGQTARRDVTLAAGGSPTVTFEIQATGGIVEISATSSLTFSSDDVTISPGTTVRWTNTSSLFHTVTPDGHTEWSSADLSGNGSTFSHTFSTPGTYAYFCSPHQGDGMVGVIRVQ